MKNRTPLIILLNIIVLFYSCRNKSDKVYKSEVSVTDQTQQLVEDIEGNVYKTVKIGNQTWMTKNLKTTRYNDGTPIPLVTDGAAWAALSTPAYCWYNNDSLSYKNIYGALYNGYAVMTGKLCPTNWHVATDAEWKTLINYLGGEYYAADRLKETGTDYWVSPNAEATNESGYTALPGGLRYWDGVFHDFGFGGYWWTSTEYSETQALFRYMDYEYSNVFGFNNRKNNGFSIRCLRDY
jgi:uncharacterized protein (TIGR02145 family)